MTSFNVVAENDDGWRLCQQETTIKPYLAAERRYYAVYTSS
jgi:hypothetical protein